MGCVCVVFAAVSVLYVAELDLEVDEVLDAEDLVVLDWVLLVDALTKSQYSLMTSRLSAFSQKSELCMSL